MRAALFGTCVLLSASLIGCSHHERAAATPAITAGEVRNIQVTPTFVDDGLTLSTQGTISELGKGEVVIHLNAVAQPSATCTAVEGGGKRANLTAKDMALTASQTIPAGSTRNRQVSFKLTTAAPSLDIGDSADCPDADDWTERVDALAIESAVLTVEQEGAIVSTLVCTFNAPTADGAVPEGNFTCASR